MLTLPKETSFEYGEDYQASQVDKHKNRKANHWRSRIELAHHLVDKYVLPKLSYESNKQIRTLDVGCSVGTIAIEMALRGFTSVGVDFDASALRIGHDLAEEEGVLVDFQLCDVAELELADEEKFDIALCFDIFEHLHDDELGALLQGIRRQMRSDGALVFYTFPLQYDYIFYSRDFLTWPLWPFKWMSEKAFERITRMYALLLDIFLVAKTGKIYKERIQKLSHCNPSTQSRIELILRRAGYDVEFIESSNIYSFNEKIIKRFGKYSVAHRNLYGVARPVKKK
ncbi:methyltransferase domain-containing protein [Hahella sp. KA22]|uniref:class I SAM-dependent methyltransferase n=1 Tax=Hahella sp. KA22 TaxID=1628392 RepID=UPI000FDE8408|nr:class I SAM-dependent methyltransferase [Hahella sp. KA22]AZZ91677.1 class I SAM-dependent methyltransferase [Hahella sp. KA22]QAY55047.1 methyltransferase domain-containing protein [Hahella sp. KA22]